jgi:uncharacterized protein YjbI with pentapeptide repeats
MFIPIIELSLYDPEEQQEVTSRWETPHGRQHYDFIMEKIREGAGEDFLQWDFENGNLQGFLRDMWDLRGFSFFNKSIDFPPADNFEAIDFSYAQFYHSTLKKCCFIGTRFNFAKFYNCNFVNCTFLFTTWRGCTFEKCSFQNTDFVEICKFINCSFTASEFTRYFTCASLFEDCKFSATVEIDRPASLPIDPNGPKIRFENKQLEEVYLSFQEAYKSGAVHDKEREYYYKSKEVGTRYNNRGILDFLYRKLLIELFTGYGVKPFRGLLCGIIAVAIFAGIFYTNSFDANDALITSISAFLTMGDANNFQWPFNLLYLAEGFIGLFILGLYLTTLVNVWFSER